MGPEILPYSSDGLENKLPCIHMSVELVHKGTRRLVLLKHRLAKCKHTRYGIRPIDIMVEGLNILTGIWLSNHAYTSLVWEELQSFKKNAASSRVSGADIHTIVEKAPIGCADA